MDWLLILVLGAVLVTAVIALAAALTAASSDREHDAHASERMAVWQAGFADSDLRVLASMAAAARAELDAGQVEVVLAHADGSGDGLVVTGSRLEAGRLGKRIAHGDGLAGRGLATGHTTLASLGGPGDADPSSGLVAMSVPIVAGGAVVGVVCATVGEGDRLFNAWHVGQLEGLAAEAGKRMGPAAGGGAREDGLETG